MEWISRSNDSAWICILGNSASDGSYERFKRRVAAANAGYSEGKLLYSDSSGIQLSFGWDADLVINGQRVTLVNYPRLDTPFVKAGWAETRFLINAPSLRYAIDLDALPEPRKPAARQPAVAVP